ncbi:hypothetical protein VSH64_08330 [Amycolatopsis rhabdoformis]|uniref:Uncharacterized protein n=1 Tax=Amycolatopsis rhabdoformis TaxID=1448059 RepID=A0ABZ1ID84_9PSEU|nr:hypothetical protein [Amycolatopsis rhabdoformis]WSE32113.1 hypothetical protein VSH64_08330 [Amycolatopsis rhabdoformis]
MMFFEDIIEKIYSENDEYEKSESTSLGVVCADIEVLAEKVEGEVEECRRAA